MHTAVHLYDVAALELVPTVAHGASAHCPAFFTRRLRVKDSAGGELEFVLFSGDQQLLNRLQLGSADAAEGTNPVQG
jgi:hypothetical protein